MFKSSGCHYIATSVISCCSNTQFGLTFWYLLTQFVLEYCLLNVQSKQKLRCTYLSPDLVLLMIVCYLVWDSV